MALTSKLSAIGDAIRSKNGTTDLMLLDDMPAAIEAIQGGGGSIEIPTMTGDCTGRFQNAQWDWFIEQCGNQITTSDISSARSMFNHCHVTKIPFEINLTDGAFVDSMFYGTMNLTSVPQINGLMGSSEQMFYQSSLTEIPDLYFNGTASNIRNMFYDCFKLERIGTIHNLSSNKGFSSVFYNCYRLKELPEFDNLDLSESYTGTDKIWLGYSGTFRACYSLRSIPSSLLKLFDATTESYNSMCSNMFFQCYALDEINCLYPLNITATKNHFSGIVDSCHRIKNFTFDVQEDGTPYVRNWTSQTIDLSYYAGYLHEQWTSNITNYSQWSGITTDKRVTDADSYAALKDDPDWWTTDAAYSRYNHDSAVETINSLPDTSAYGSNTIKFNGAAGASTDGGAINTLTEEEIAVATAKGWTVTFS